MYLASTFALIAALASSSAVRADVVPSEPSPGSVYREGQTCPIVWVGDASSPTLWKNMNIQLMTGDNFNMIHVTTVATNQDGTVNGRFEYPCPDVTVNSAIYFYQFTSPLASNKTWTTRFTIASATGETTPPANPTEPGTNAPIPWGVGALADPSKAVAPPANAGGGGAAAAASGSISASGPVLAATSSILIPATSTSLSTSSLDDIATPSFTTLIVTSSRSALASSASANPSSTPTNSATGMSATSAMTSLILSAFAFVLFL